MPTYEYQCPSCNKSLNVTRSIHDDDPGYTCEECQVQMIQQIGKLSLNFKGSGWAGSRRS